MKPGTEDVAACDGSTGTIVAVRGVERAEPCFLVGWSRRGVWQSEAPTPVDAAQGANRTSSRPHRRDSSLLASIAPRTACLGGPTACLGSSSRLFGSRPRAGFRDGRAASHGSVSLGHALRDEHTRPPPVGVDKHGQAGVSKRTGPREAQLVKQAISLAPAPKPEPGEKGLRLLKVGPPVGGSGWTPSKNRLAWSGPSEPPRLGCTKRGSANGSASAVTRREMNGRTSRLPSISANQRAWMEQQNGKPSRSPVPPSPPSAPILGSRLSPYG